MAGVRVSKMCWMSSSSSTATGFRRCIVQRPQAESTSLHLIEHGRERRLQPERLLDLVGCDIRVLAVLEEARDLVIADELDEALRVLSPILRETLEIGENG